MAVDVRGGARGTPGLLVAALLAVMALVMDPPPVPASEPVLDDRFIAGYASAILRREFGLAVPVHVTAGVIVLPAGVVARTPAIVEALRAVPGVRDVRTTGEARATAGGTASDSGPTAAADVARTGASGAAALVTGFLPGGELFRPLIADPRWPHLGFFVSHTLSGRQPTSVAAPSIGETIALYRGDEAWGGGQWEIGLLGAAFSIFDLDSDSLDLVNTDFLAGLFLAYRRDALSAVARLIHQSSHLSDEGMQRRGTERINLSFERLDVLVSWDPREWIRLYGGPGVLVRRDPPDLDPWSLQAGTELRGPALFSRVRPVVGADLQIREYAHWKPSLSLRAGLEYRSPDGERAAQLLLQYFNGRAPDGQFLREHLEYIGDGLHLS
jgi:hypothetical protein